jgi:hypothetical protein
MRFGRLPHDSVAMAQAPAHRFGSVAPPAALDRTPVIFRPELYANNVLPDCTAVALANAARGVAALNGYDLIVDPPSVPAFYASCIGNPPNLAATEGAVMLDVLRHQATKGFNVGPQTLYGLFGTVNTTSRIALARSIARLGVGYWGVTLRERDAEGAAVWDVAAGRDDGAIICGHAVIAWDYTGLTDDAAVRLGTWGSWQSATWAWVAERLDEAHALVWRQLERADGTFYNGLTPDGLVTEIAAY